MTLNNLMTKKIEAKITRRLPVKERDKKIKIRI